MPGFRVPVELSSSKGSVLKKCFIFVDEKWSKVVDLENHVRNLFNLEDVELFVGDCWLPSGEPICIVQRLDVITAKKRNHSRAAQHSDSEGEEDVRNRKEKGRKSKKDPSTSAPEVKPEPSNDLDALKGELLSRVEALDQESMDVTDSGEPKKRKRKRKHKSKLSRIPTLAFLQPEPAAPNSAIPVDEASETSGGPSNPSHIRFDEDTSTVPNGSLVPEPPVLEEWQERLLSLAHEGTKKVFVRRSEKRGSANTANGATPEENGHADAPAIGNGHCTNGFSKENGETAPSEPSSVPIEMAKTNDVIYFKILTVDGSSPTVSDRILGLVEDVDGEGLLTLKILEGKADELFDPDQILDSEDGYFVVKISWSQVLEPALVVDRSTLSKYL